MHARIAIKLFAVAAQGEQLTKATLLTSRGRLAILGEHVDAFDFEGSPAEVLLLDSSGALLRIWGDEPVDSYTIVNIDLTCD